MARRILPPPPVILPALLALAPRLQLVVGSRKTSPARRGLDEAARACPPFVRFPAQVAPAPQASAANGIDHGQRCAPAERTCHLRRRSLPPPPSPPGRVSLHRDSAAAGFSCSRQRCRPPLRAAPDDHTLGHSNRLAAEVLPSHGIEPGPSRRPPPPPPLVGRRAAVCAAVGAHRLGCAERAGSRFCRNLCGCGAAAVHHWLPLRCALQVGRARAWEGRVGQGTPRRGGPRRGALCCARLHCNASSLGLSCDPSEAGRLPCPTSAAPAPPFAARRLWCCHSIEAWGAACLEGWSSSARC